MISREAAFAGIEGRVFYRAWEPGTPPHRIVIIVHGYAEHSARYTHVAEILAAAGSAVYAQDHLGHGHSDGERALIVDFEHIVDDLATLAGIAAAEHPGLPVVFAGHSMGGLLASRYAQRHPEKVAGLILMGAVIGDWRWAREVLEKPAMPDPPTDWSGMSRDPETVRQYSSDPLVYRGPVPQNLGMRGMLSKMHDMVAQIKLPALIMAGNAGPDGGRSKVLYEYIGSADKTLKLYDGLLHEIFNEPEHTQVMADMEKWLEAHR